MVGEIEALGGLATAGLAAQALDGETSGHAGDGLCANCAATVGGKFCANCGQAAHVHRSLLHVGEEFLHGITHFDGKAWQTLPMLLFRPGRLTREYIFGRRARYVAPVPLFLLVVFTMVLVFSMVAPSNFGVNVLDTKMTVAEAKAGLEQTNKALADINTALYNARDGGKAKAEEIAVLETARAASNMARKRFEARILGKPPADGETRSSVLEAIKQANADGKLNINVGSPELAAKVHHALENPELALYKIQGVAYKFSFLLVPLSLPWLWLLFFWKRGVRMYDHAVFSLYSISFMSLLFTAVSVLFAIGVTSPLVYVTLLLLVPLVHMYAQLRGTYAVSAFGAAWRTFVLANLSIAVLSVYASLMFILGLID